MIRSYLLCIRPRLLHEGATCITPEQVRWRCDRPSRRKRYSVCQRHLMVWITLSTKKKPRKDIIHQRCRAQVLAIPESLSITEDHSLDRRPSSCRLRPSPSQAAAAADLRRPLLDCCLADTGPAPLSECRNHSTAEGRQPPLPTGAAPLERRLSTRKT